MNKREMAAKLLSFFGLDGKNWKNGAGNGENTGCLTEAIDLLPYDNDEKEAFQKEIRARLKVTDLNGVQSWNDRQKWPAVKRLVVSIRDRRKFDKKAAEALTARIKEREDAA